MTATQLSGAFGSIGQASPPHAFARKNIDVAVASRRPPEALAPQARAIGPTVVAKSLRDALEADIDHLWRSRSGSTARLRRLCRAGKARRSSTRRTRSEFPWKNWAVSRPPPFIAKAFTGARLVKGFNHLVAATLATDPIVEGGHRVVFLVERRRGRDRSRGGLGQTTRVRTRQAGKAQRGWRAGARTRPHLGPAHLPGFVQEGAVADLLSAVRGAALKEAKGSPHFVPSPPPGMTPSLREFRAVRRCKNRCHPERSEGSLRHLRYRSASTRRAKAGAGWRRLG